MIKLPIGIQTFCRIIEGNFYYVDKINFELRLIENNGYNFLFSPRGFGKTH